MRYDVGLRDDLLACASHSAWPAALRELRQAFDSFLELQFLLDGNVDVVGRNPIEDSVAVSKRFCRPNDLRQLRSAGLSSCPALREMS